jgi:hypothetical protein
MDKTFSIAEFCADEGLSLSFFYKLDRLGKAPATFKVGKLRINSCLTNRKPRLLRGGASNCYPIDVGANDWD